MESPTTNTNDEDKDMGRAHWARIQAELRAAHGEDIYASWFERIEFESVTGDVVELSTPTPFIRHWTQTQYGTEILQRWRSVDPATSELRFKVRSPLRPRSVPRATAPNRVGAPSQPSPAVRRAVETPAAPVNQAGGLEGSPLEPRYTFDTLVEGAANAFAVAAAKKVAFSQPGERIAYNPLFVSAPVGLGKTHLLQAIASAAGLANPARRVLYLTAEHFMYRFLSAIRNKTTISFKDILRDIDILLIDDMQFLNGAKVHEEFGHTLTTLVDSQRQVVIAADRAPADLDGLEPRVRSRLGGGLLVELETPDYVMRKAILEQRIAAQRESFENLVFPAEVIDFVARSITTNGRDLEGAVNRLVAHNQLTGTAIDLKMAETALRDLLRARETRRPKIEDIQRVTSQHFGVSRQDLVSARRTRIIVRPRQIAMYLSKTLTPRSLPEIGRRFGNRDHTTVLHAVRKVEEMIDRDPQVAEDIETLKRLLDQ
ncbi:chromosomal replication initiator protein DnaA [Acuticoccus sp. 2012]|uniref:Chromosomal replication initiator protein DnaA n=2 Tax=Acuticoccus mangrovi TaxID=2796142 RepID=A0A934IP00_9HYPH|nr:chromosomal replication initiator protein DnaA [Acuticoccus mangrovi]